LRTALLASLGGVRVEHDAWLVMPRAGCGLVAVAPACACVAARPARRAARASWR